jgi:hypothetical protein
MTEKTEVATSTTDLIASAKALIIKPRETKDDKDLVEASDPSIINELLAARQNIEDQMKPLSEKKSEIDAIIKDLIGKADVLTVHGAEVASISRWRETQLNSDFIKENFPVADYPEMFKRVAKSRLNIKK